MKHTQGKELKKALIEGEIFIFDNEKHNELTMSDDFRSAECSFRNEAKNAWANGFKIEFNGALFSFKRFDAFERKLDQLIADWNLEFKETANVGN